VNEVVAIFFQSQEFAEFPTGKQPCFVDKPWKARDKNQLGVFSHFDTIQACARHAKRRDAK